jgi:hypothetical protein
MCRKEPPNKFLFHPMWFLSRLFIMAFGGQTPATITTLLKYGILPLKLNTFEVMCKTESVGLTINL